MEKPSASASENWQKIIAIEAACNCDAVEYEGQRSSSRMNGSAEVISKFSSLSETGTEIENGESSSGIPSMPKESYQFESDDDVIELEAVPITKIRFKQLVQQDVPAKMRADFHRKRRAKRKSYGIPPKKLKSNIKQEPKEGCCVYCFSDEESDLKCGKLLKQHGIIIHQHCMYFASDLVQNQEYVDVDDERTSMRGVVDDVKTTGVSPWITKKSLSSKKINAPFEAQSNSNAWIMGFPVDGIRRDLHRVSSSHRCTYCGFGGASIGCSKRRCTVEFHMPCGLKNGVFFQHFGKFQSFCRRHAPEQPWNTPAKGIKQLVFARFSGVKLMKPGQIMCIICTSSVFFSRAVRGQVVRTSCCKKNDSDDLYRYYHWKCIQQYAFNHGDGHLRCLMCKNEKEFRQQLLDAGLYIPSRDASWEFNSQPHFSSSNVAYNFDSMYVRKFDCSAFDCTCPDGRGFCNRTGNWMLNYCEDCGSTAFHTGCRANWKCKSCGMCVNPQTSSNADSNNKLWPSTNFPVAQSSSICDRLLPSIVAIENQNRGKFESPPGSTSNFD